MTERYYTDGTEPDVLPHFGGCCTGMCQQGRACPERHSDDRAHWVQRTVDAFAVLGLIAALAFVVGYVAG